MAKELTPEQQLYYNNKMQRAISFTKATCSKCGHAIKPDEWFYRDVRTHDAAHVTCRAKKDKATESEMQEVA